jgi:hypothetical protein
MRKRKKINQLLRIRKKQIRKNLKKRIKRNSYESW